MPDASSPESRQRPREKPVHLENGPDMTFCGASLMFDPTIKTTPYPALTSCNKCWEEYKHAMSVMGTPLEDEA